MTWERAAWVIGGYLAGTLPSTYLVLRILGRLDVIRLARRERSEADAHVLIRDHVSGAWAAVAGTADVAKGFVVALMARTVGDLPAGWLAGVGVAVVAGHAFPPYARLLAGRGLAAAAGVFLALLPQEMVVAGLVTLVGVVLRWAPVASTIGFGAVPVASAILGRPGPLVAMGAGVFAVILLRRLQGVVEVVRSGISWPRALYYRAVHDASGRPTRGS